MVLSIQFSALFIPVLAYDDGGPTDGYTSELNHVYDIHNTIMKSMVATAPIQPVIKGIDNQPSFEDEHEKHIRKLVHMIR